MIAKDAYPYASVNAFNFWGAMKLSWETDTGKWLGVSHNSWGMLMFGIASVTVLVGLIRKKSKPKVEDYLYVTALLSLVAFTFLTRVHERHIFPFFLFYLW